MKRILFLLSIFVTSLGFSQADCSNAQTINLQVDGTITVNSGGVSGTPPATACFAGYDSSQITAGDWYEFSLSQEQEVTVFADVPADLANDYVASFTVHTGSCNNLTCIDGSFISAGPEPAEFTFTANANTTYYIVFDDFYANIPPPDGPLGTTDPFTFDVTAESCTDSAPGLATNPNPADGAQNVVVTTTDNNETSVNFGWDEPAAGPVNDYVFTVSEDPNLDPNDDTTVSGTFGTSGPFDIFVPNNNYFQVSTTYYWSVTPQNCAGQPSNNPVIWSFTTDDTLSAEDFEEAVSFEFFINNGLLNISANQSFDQINIYNLSGQQIMDKALSSNDENISIQSLAKGLYLAKVQIGNQTKTFKFIK